MPLGLEGITDGSLRERVRDLGGKHGILQHLQENPVKGVTVVPSELLLQDDKSNFSLRQRLKALCRGWRTNELIVRSSQRADLDGLVDVMPTRIHEMNGWWFDHGLSTTINEVRLGCNSEAVVSYAQQEGAAYDPSGITVSLAPHINIKKSAVVTEHPNQEGVVLIDIKYEQGPFKMLNFEYG